MRDYIYKLENMLLMKLAIILGMLAMMLAKSCDSKSGVFIFYEEEIPQSLIKEDI